MRLADIVEDYRARLQARYGATLNAEQWSALNALVGCRTEQYGETLWACTPCHRQQRFYQACGHRSCPRCQNHDTTQWLERQQQKLLPVEYFLVTFTLPRELRDLAKRHPKTVYNLMLRCVSGTLKSFGLNKRRFNAQLGMTAVLHTHSRRLDYHPHIHVAVPSGGIDTKRKQWRKLKGHYLFKAFNLARVFRARLLAALKEARLALPAKVPAKWVADCTHVGRGLPALQYLSRYIYRGVLSEKQIVSDDGERVTFAFTNSETGKTEYRTLRGETFLYLLLQHVLPKGFRRVRDYGFLHGNAKRLLKLVQWVLRAPVFTGKTQPKPTVVCSQCHAPMTIIAIIKPGHIGYG